MSTMPGRNRRILTYILAFCLMVTALIYLFFGKTAVAQGWRIRRAEEHRSLILRRLEGDPRYREIKVGIMPSEGGCALITYGVVATEADIEYLKGIIHMALPSVNMHYRVVIMPPELKAVKDRDAIARDLPGQLENGKRIDPFTRPPPQEDVRRKDVQEDPRAFTTVDSWYNPPPRGHRFYFAEVNGNERFYKLGHGDIYEVHASKEADAEKLLETSPCLAMDIEKARNLIGKEYYIHEGRTPFLVRGIYLRRDTGGFDAYVMDGDLLVDHGCLGQSPRPMKRQALILILFSMPQKVYVNCHMAE